MHNNDLQSDPQKENLVIFGNSRCIMSLMEWKILFLSYFISFLLLLIIIPRICHLYYYVVIRVDMFKKGCQNLLKYKFFFFVEIYFCETLFWVHCFRSNGKLLKNGRLRLISCLKMVYYLDLVLDRIVFYIFSTP